MITVDNKMVDKALLLANAGEIILNDVDIDKLPVIKEMKCLKEYLDLPMGDPKEAEIKKIFTSAIVIAKEKGILPFNIEKDSVAIATAVDEGLTRVKVAYKVAQGDLSESKAIDVLVDKCTSRTIAAVDVIIDKGAPIFAERLAMALTTNVYTAPLAPVVGVALPYVAPYVKDAVHKGIGLLAKSAKSVLKKGIPALVQKAKGVFNKIFA